jgi:hypothetical protein
VTLTAIAFNTQFNYDLLYVNNGATNVPYSGPTTDYFPQGAYQAVGAVIYWRTNGDTTGTGFKVCGGAFPPPRVRTPRSRADDLQRWKSVANRNGGDFGWEIAHEAVSRRPPIPLYTILARTEVCAILWDLSIRSLFSVAPRQTRTLRFATFASLYAGRHGGG